MLHSLSIRDLAVVGKVDLSIASGMSVITGETGAGKSILVDALALIAGGRGDSGAVRTGAERTEIAAEFDLSRLPLVQQWLQDQALDDEHNCLLRRVVRADGGSRGFINGRAATLLQLRELAGLLVEIHGHVATLTLNSPPVNALTRTLNDELTRALDQISEIDDIRAVVLTGAGKVFCAGADLKGRAEVIKGSGDLPAHSRRTRECFHAIRECAKPVVIAINGAALGSGVAMAASADILVASTATRLGLPEVDVGLLGGCRHAMRLFSHSRLRRMALTGMRVDGPELYRLGIVEACVAPEDLMATAMEIAQTIASKSPVSTRMGKHTLNVIEDMSLRDGYRYEQDMTAQIAKTDDAKEAQAAFREKRAPVFTGR